MASRLLRGRSGVSPRSKRWRFASGYVIVHIAIWNTRFLERWRPDPGSAGRQVSLCRALSFMKRLLTLERRLRAEWDF
eukprot:2523013-Pleurochrysis_carterae.AAC.2